LKNVSIGSRGATTGLVDANPVAPLPRYLRGRLTSFTFGCAASFG